LDSKSLIGEKTIYLTHRKLNPVGSQIRPIYATFVQINWAYILQTCQSCYRARSPLSCAKITAAEYPLWTTSASQTASGLLECAATPIPATFRKTTLHVCYDNP